MILSFSETVLPSRSLQSNSKIDGEKNTIICDYYTVLTAKLLHSKI